MGSPTGIWTSVSGAMAQSQNVDTIANNIANANTSGFKKDTVAFKEYLTAYEKTPDPAIDIPRTKFKDQDFYHHDGKEHAMVNVDRVVTDHSQGSFKTTNAPFDLAVDGPGFFAVKTPQGVKYTRSGDFKIDGTGKLVTADGLPILAIGGEAAPAEGQQPAGSQPDATRNPASVNPFLVSAELLNTKPDPNNPNAPKSPLVDINLADALNAGQKITITTTGEVFAGTEQVAKLAVAEFTNPSSLKKLSSQMFENVDQANVPKVADKSNIRQGYLEMSNVNTVSELMELLKANRMFESNMRAIRAYSEMSAKEANEVGKL